MTSRERHHLADCRAAWLLENANAVCWSMTQQQSLQAICQNYRL